MEYLTTGEMARYCGVTKRTLWLYHEKDLLSPEKIDEETGYYYYNPRQRRQLDKILHLKALGLTLEQIGELLACDDPGQLARLFHAHIQSLEEEMERIQTALFGTRLLLCPAAFLQRDPIADKVKLEYMTPCKYLRIDSDCNTDETYFDPQDPWIDQAHKLRAYLNQEKIPLSAYYVGHVYPETEPGRHSLICSDITTYIDASFSHGNTAFIPEGHYMTLIFSDRCDIADSSCREQAYQKIVEETRRRNYTICGKAFDEQLLVNDDYTMSVRMMVPVKVPKGTYLGV